MKAEKRDKHRRISRYSNLIIEETKNENYEIAYIYLMKINRLLDNLIANSNIKLSQSEQIKYIQNEENE